MLVLLISLCFSQIYYENLDEKIRFQEDPNYADYIRQKVRQKKVQKRAAKEQREARAKKETLNEKRRRAYVKQRNKEQAANAAAQKLGLKEQLQREKKATVEYEKSRKKYVKERNIILAKEREKKSIELARMRREVEKLPDSFFEQSHRPKVERKNRKFGK